MKKQTRSLGFTLVEGMLTVTILSIITLMVVPFISISQRGFSSNEVSNALKTNSQQIINLIAVDLTQCKRLFENSVAESAFLARVTLSTAPAALAGSKMATKEEHGSISPSTTAFVSASVGNSLFFANINQPLDVTVLDSGGASRNVRIDLYTFNYIYLAEDTTQTVASQRKIQLWKWQSITYADYNQLVGISDNTKRTNTGIATYAAGVRYAWNPSTSGVNAAFYALGSGGALSLNAGHNIGFGSASPLFRFTTGLSGTSFRYGVSPNTGGSYTIRQTVPQFATGASKFPSGFEVITIGANSARQIFIRLVLVAQGSFKNYMSNEDTVLVTVRDLW